MHHVGDASFGPLDVELLPARHGDAVLLTWGPLGQRHRMLIDGGPATAYPEVSARLRDVRAEGSIDVLVLTHIDADHIEGTLLLANDADLDIGIDECWFNGPAQVEPTLGVAQGEMLAALITARGIPLNAAFDNAAVAAAAGAPLPVRHLPGGLRLTVLGPGPDDLARLRTAWRSALDKANLAFTSKDAALDALRARRNLMPDDPFLSEKGHPSVIDLGQQRMTKDSSVSNRSSIALLAEYAGNAVLLPGDATPRALLAGVRRLLSERGVARLDLTAFKLPHHGSAKNVTPELLTLLPAEYYLFSSDGAQHGHPDAACVARCLIHGRRGAALAFNYVTDHTERWRCADVLEPYGARALYPADGTAGIALSLAPVPEEV